MDPPHPPRSSLRNTNIPRPTQELPSVVNHDPIPPPTGTPPPPYHSTETVTFSFSTIGILTPAHPIWRVFSHLLNSIYAVCSYLLGGEEAIAIHLQENQTSIRDLQRSSTRLSRKLEEVQRDIHTLRQLKNALSDEILLVKQSLRNRNNQAPPPAQ